MNLEEQKIEDLFIPERVSEFSEDEIGKELHALHAAPNVQEFFFRSLESELKFDSCHGSILMYLFGLCDQPPAEDESALMFDPTMPDIDIDFSDTHRDLVFTYLEEKYGKDRVARIGNVSTLQPRGVLSTVGKTLGIPLFDTFAVRNVLLEYGGGDARAGAALEDTIETTDPGKKFLKDHPHATIMYDCEGAARHTSVHAAGVVVSPEPITEFASCVDGVLQMEKNTAEKINFLKIDALGLTTLGIIEDTGVVTAEELYALKFDDQEVFDVVNDRRYAGVFQLEGAAARRVAAQIHLRSLDHMNHVNALSRPGPLGGGATAKYMAMERRDAEPEYAHESLRPFLEATHGLAIYQEQVMNICRYVGRFSWRDITTIRRAMSKRMGEEFFNRYRDLFAAGAAVDGIDAKTSEIIWQTINSFGAYGFNLSHAASYSMIGYWTMWMKRYHPMEYAAALLRRSKSDEQAIEVLRELREEGVTYVPFDQEKSEVDWAVKDGVMYGGFQNLVGIGPAKATGLVERRDAGELTAKDLKTIEKAEVKFSDLTEAHTLWGHLYDDPLQVNVRTGIKQIGELTDNENAVLIVKMIRRDRRDENESVRAQRRGGRKWTRGCPLFLDMYVVDDTVTQPKVCRIQRHHWHKVGVKIADRAVDGKDWFLIRAKWLAKYEMLSCEKIRCLTNPEVTA